MAASMNTDSDTESESSSGSQCESGSSFPARLSTTLTSSTSLYVVAQEAQDGINTIMSIEVNEIRDELTERDSDRIQRASVSLQALLDAFSSRRDACMRCLDTRYALCSLLQIDCLERLFSLRQAFHVIALQAIRTSKPQFSVICWVDVILARLGDAVMVIIEGESRQSRPGTTDATTLSTHKDEIALHAALQLPHNWDETLSTISSESTSPAAMRLAVRLAFAAYMLPLRIGIQDEDHNWPRYGPQPERVLKTLRVLVHRTFGDDLCLRNDDFHIERTTCAMILSLYALADIVRSTRANSPIRPHTGAALLNLIRFVTEDNARDHKNIVFTQPTQDLNAAQTVIFRWSTIIAWMWTMWDDERALDYVIVERATISWLHHLRRHPWTPDDASTDYQTELLANLSMDWPSSRYIISIILSRAATTYRSPSPSSCGEALETVYRCCWGANKILEAYQEYENPVVQSMIESLAELFVYLPDDSAKSAEVKDVILIGLTSVDTRTLRSALSVCGIKSIFKLRLEDKMTFTAHRLMPLTGSPSPASEEDFKRSVQLLHFLTLMRHASVDGLVHEQSISTFIHTALDCVSNTHTALKTLLGPLITVQVLFETDEQSGDRSRDRQVKERRQAIWDLSLDQNVANIPVTAAFACYISATLHRYPPKQSYLIEAWNQMRDFIFLVHRRHFHGVDEPLSLLVCPAACKAMRDILQHGGGTLDFLRASPWTASFYNVLMHLRDREGDEEYDQALSGTLRDHISALCDEIEYRVHGKGDSSHVKQVSPVPNRLLVFEQEEETKMFLAYG